MHALPNRQTARRWIPLACAAIALVCSTAGVVHAQPTPPPEGAQQAGEGRQGRRGPGMAMLQEYRQLIGELNLTAEQQPQLREAMRKNVEAMRSLQQDAETMSPQDRLASMNEAIDKLNSDISAMLTEEQRKTFEPRAAEIKARMERNAIQQARGNRAGNDADGAATRPATQAAGGRWRPGERVEAALEAAEVTDEQRTKLKPALDTLREDVAALMAEGADGDRQAMRGKVREIIDGFMTKANEVLSPEQMQKFRGAMAPGQGGGNRPNGGPNGRPAGGGQGDGMNDTPPAQGQKPAAAAPPDMGGGMDAGMAADPGMTATAGANKTTKPEAGTAGLAASEVPDAPALAIGDALPEFSLTEIDGRVINRAKLVGKPSVILFGSYTAPSFRDQAPLLQQLAKRFNSRVNWLVVYTREMHPSGSDEPERNRDDRITVAAHTTMHERTAAARSARDQLRLSMNIAPDAMDNAFTKQFGGFPNAAFVFDEAGKLVAKQQWADVFAIERALDRELKRK